MKNTIPGMLFVVCSFLCIDANSQSTDSVVANTHISQKLSDKYIAAMGNRSSEYQEKMAQETEKYLNKLKAQELVLQNQLAKIHPEEAQRIFNGSEQAYNNIQSDLKNNSDRVLKTCGKYVPGIDSAITSLKFLQQNEVTGKIAGNVSQVKNAIAKVKGLQDQFTKTDNVEEFIKQRKEYLTRQLSSFKLPGMEQYSQQAAYFGQQLGELEQDWDDPSRIEKKALTILSKVPEFQEFMKKNSMIASLFNLPDDYGSSGVAGLQTKDMVQQMMKESMLNMGASGAQTAQQNIGDAQSTLSDLRGKLNSGSSELSMPDGKGNNQHTKSLFKRIQYGMDMQSTKSNLYFPNKTNFCFTAGYRLDDRNTLGVGLDYGVGWGRDIQHISVTSQSIGFRFYGEFKIKGSFYGSSELDYNYSHPFASINQLRNEGLWTRSGLVGITKLVSIRSKLVKKTKLQLLWNILYYYETPKISQPIIFRVGYNF